MDENAVRLLLREVAEDQLPPMRIDLAEAARAGRRALRWRRRYLPAVAPIAAAAAVAIIIGLLTVTGAGLHHGTGPATDTRLPAAPDKFSSLMPYARFGWLPGGGAVPYSTSQTTWNQEIQTSGGHGDAADLQIYPASACKITGAVTLSGKTLPHGLTCAGNLGPTALTGPAPDVNGGPAYWTSAQGIVWEYGRNAWAWLVTSGGHPALPPAASIGLPLPAAAATLLHKVAARVRFGYQPVRYGFTVSGLPTSWQPRTNSIENVATIAGQPVNVGYQAGPASDPTALTIKAVAASERTKVCGFGPSKAGSILFDGVRAGLRTLSNHGLKYIQNLCAPHVDGMQIFISLDLSTQGSPPSALPGGRQVADMRTFLSHLRLLGPDVADWATRPAR
jgi:hypothetical protein